MSFQGAQSDEDDSPLQFLTARSRPQNCECEEEELLLIAERRDTIGPLFDAGADEVQLPNANGDEGVKVNEKQDDNEVLSIIKDCLNQTSDRHQHHHAQRRSSAFVPHAKIPKQLLIELFERVPDVADLSDTYSWQQSARFIKYEENVNGVDQRFGRAHIPFVTMRSIMQLKKLLSQCWSLFSGPCAFSALFVLYLGTISNPHTIFGACLLNVECNSLNECLGLLCTALAKHYNMNERKCQTLIDCLREKNRHVETDDPAYLRAQFRKPSRMDFTHRDDFDAQVKSHDPHSEGPSSARKTSVLSRTSEILHRTTSYIANASWTEHEAADDTQAAQIYVAKLAQLSTARCALLRLRKPCVFPELLDSPDTPIRFLIVIFGPESHSIDYHQVGRAFATLLTNESFQQRLYGARNRIDISHALEHFLEESVLAVPPGPDCAASSSLFDGKSLMHAVAQVTTSPRHHACTEPASTADSPVLHGHHDRTSPPPASTEHEHSITTNRKALGVGVRDDFQGRWKDYRSDFSDALQLKVVASSVFMYFAAFAPAVTFGGLMGSYTRDSMGITEMLISQSVCGVLWSLLSAQPLILQAATGPMLIFEASLFVFCKLLHLHFLTIRLWVSIWLAVFCVLAAVTEISVYIKYITRFTEDVFSVLISAIFIFETILFLKKTLLEHPIRNIDFYNERMTYCYEQFANGTRLLSPKMVLGKSRHECLQHDQPDTTLLTVFVVLGTFLISYLFRIIRHQVYLGKTVRRALADFSLLLAILIMTLLDKLVFANVFMQRVDIGLDFGLTNSGLRAGWFVPWLLPDHHWGYVFAIIPALLAFILIFLETEVTELIMLKPALCLQKGSGGHNYDLLVVALLLFIGGVFGLPWMCATAAQSIGHVNSLTVFTPGPPGAKNEVNYVIEQRVTGLVASVAIGLSALAGPLLKELPVAVLYGMLVYLGVANLSGLQFINRLLLIFVPIKYYPDLPYCQKVYSWRMHSFTCIQLVAFVLIYTVKSIKYTAMLFPFLVLLMCAARKWVLPRLYTIEELNALDAHEDEE